MSQKYKYQHNWLIETDLEKIKDKLRLLEEALENKDFEKITSFLKNTVFLRSIIVQKGAGGNPHKLLEKSFIFLLAHNFGEGKDFFSLTAEEIIDFLHKNDLPEQLLNELANIAYHQRNKNKFLKITDIILENKNSFF